MIPKFKENKRRKNESLEEYIWNNYQPLFRKIAKKYEHNNTMYEFNDIITEAYLIAVKLAKNYVSCGKNSYMFGYINKYISIQVHNLITVKQLINVDRNKVYKDKKYKQNEYVNFEELHTKTQTIKEIEEVEYSKHELYKILEDNVFRNKITKEDFEYIKLDIKKDKNKFSKRTEQLISLITI